jgi:acetyl esterase/lipase
MDVYRPDVPNGLGIVVINGSGWFREPGYDSPMLKDSAGLRPATEKLLSAGYTAFVINHRASPGFHVQDAIADAQRAVRFVRANAARYGISPDQIGVLGGSSGAHLASMLGTMDAPGDSTATDPVERVSARAQVVVALFPPIDLATLNTPDGAAAVAAITGLRPPDGAGGPPASPARVRVFREVSPIGHVSATSAPFLLIHGDADQTVPFHQSEVMENALRAAGVDAKLVRVPGGGHGASGPAWARVDWAGMTLDWFNGHLPVRQTAAQR